jgi:hypothetical protein
MSEATGYRTVGRRPQALTTPRSAAIAGILFAVLLASSLVLIRLSVPADLDDAGDWLQSRARRNAVVVALNLVPFAGIAFLWFIGVVRDRIGDFEDRFFSTVFLGSGLLFLAMLFASTAVAGALVGAYGQGELGPDVWAFGRTATYTTLSVYATKMAGVFMVSTATISLRTGVLPRWLALLGLLLAFVLLLSVTAVAWIELIFPLWVLMVSIHVLRARFPRRVDAAR